LVISRPLQFWSEKGKRAGGLVIGEVYLLKEMPSKYTQRQGTGPVGKVEALKHGSTERLFNGARWGVYSDVTQIDLRGPYGMTGGTPAD
jgi:hypothetical protein